MPRLDALQAARLVVTTTRRRRGSHTHVARLLALLVVPAGALRSGWDQAKADPPRPSPQRMREHLAHLGWLRGQAVPEAAFAGVPGVAHAEVQMGGAAVDHDGTVTPAMLDEAVARVHRALDTDASPAEVERLRQAARDVLHGTPRR